MFYNKVWTHQDTIRGASLVLQGNPPLDKVSEATKELARTFLDSVTNPRLLPVPLHYDRIARLCMGDLSEYKKKIQGWDK